MEERREHMRRALKRRDEGFKGGKSGVCHVCGKQALCRGLLEESETRQRVVYSPQGSPHASSSWTAYTPPGTPSMEIFDKMSKRSSSSSRSINKHIRTCRNKMSMEY